MSGLDRDRADRATAVTMVVFGTAAALAGLYFYGWGSGVPLMWAGAAVFGVWIGHAAAVFRWFR